MVSSKHATPPTTTRAIAPQVEAAPDAPPATATVSELQDIKALCCCLPISQRDNYSTWIRIGMILKKLGAPVSMWEDVSKRSKKYKHGD